MKAKTELNGIELRQAFALHRQCVDQVRKAPKTDLSASSPASVADQSGEPSASSAADAVAVSEQKQDVDGGAAHTSLSESDTSEVSSQSPSDSEVASLSDEPNLIQGSSPSSELTSPTEPQPVDVEARLAAIQKKKEEEHKKRTEARQKLLDAAKPLFVEAIKSQFSNWTDEKIDWVLDALTLIDSRRLPLLRKVRILSLDKDSEKIPTQDAKKIGDLLFIADYLPPLHAPRERDGRDRKGSRSRDKSAKHPRGQGRRDRVSANPRDLPSSDRPQGQRPPRGRSARKDARPVVKTPPSGIGPKPILPGQLQSSNPSTGDTPSAQETNHAVDPQGH